MNEATKRANARYDAKRPVPVTGRLNAEERAFLDRHRQEGESYFQALKRLAIPDYVGGS